MANISRTEEDIQNPSSTLSTTVPPALGELWSSNFGDLEI